MSSWSEAVWVVQRMKTLLDFNSQMASYATLLNELNGNIIQLAGQCNTLANRVNADFNFSEYSDTLGDIYSALYGQEATQTMPAKEGLIDKTNRLQTEISTLNNSTMSFCDTEDINHYPVHMNEDPVADMVWFVLKD